MREDQDGVVSLFHFAELHEHLAHLPLRSRAQARRGPGVKDQPLLRYRSAVTGLQIRCYGNEPDHPFQYTLTWRCWDVIRTSMTRENVSVICWKLSQEARRRSVFESLSDFSIGSDRWKSRN